MRASRIDLFSRTLLALARYNTFEIDVDTATSGKLSQLLGIFAIIVVFQTVAQLLFKHGQRWYIRS